MAGQLRSASASARMQSSARLGGPWRGRAGDGEVLQRGGSKEGHGQQSTRVRREREQQWARKLDSKVNEAREAKGAQTSATVVKKRKRGAEHRT
jgi:hypothetical protein